MKKVVVFGATGGTGLAVVKQALDAGYQVTSIVRNPDAFPVNHRHLEVIKGDVLVPSSFENSIKHDSIVVSCLGVRKNEPTVVYSQGISMILEAMKKVNANRIVCLSAIAVVIPPKGSWMLKFVTKNILQRFFGNMYKDMLRMEDILKCTDVNWTIIRPPWLRDGKRKGAYRVAINEFLASPSKINREDLAEFIVSYLDDQKLNKARVELSY